jgi:hypothetical protein
MGATGLLTILAILISGYGLLPDEKRLDIRLRISWLKLVFIAIPVIAILIVIYSPVILGAGFIEPLDWRWGFTEDTMVFSCLLFVILFFGWILIGSRLPAANYTRWAKDSEQYLRGKKFEQLGYLLNKYHVQLFGVIERNVWYVRLHNYLMPRSVLLILHLGEKRPFYEPYLNDIRKILAKPFPSSCKRQDVLELSMSRMLKCTPFVDYLAETYPMVAAKASCIRLLDGEVFITSFFKALMSHSGSPLYRELRDNQNCSHTGEYFLDESNPLLNFYLKDIAVAQRVAMWKPVGDYVLNYIKKQRGKDNFYNQPNSCFSDGEERWACPIFIGSQFFEVMVSIAIFQRANDHMWLMYTNNFLEEILESLDHAPDVEKDREFPSKFDYLMYQVFSSCSGWVGTVEHLDFTDVSAEDIRHFPEYWAAKTLGCMLRKIIMSDKLPDSQKGYFLEIAVRRVRSLDQKGLSLYSKLVVDNCVRTDEHTAADDEVLEKLRHLYGRVDHVLRHGESTFETEMTKYLAAV